MSGAAAKDRLASFDADETDAALLHEGGSVGGAPGRGEPRMTTPQDRVAREWQFAFEGEDLNAVIGPRADGRRRKAVSEKFSQRVIRCIASASRSSASWITASGLPEKSSTPKTSTSWNLYTITARP